MLLVQTIKPFSFDMAPVTFGGWQEFNSLPLLRQASMETATFAKEKLDLEDGSENWTDSQVIDSDALSDLLASSVGKVLANYDMKEFGAILIHKHFDCAENELQVTRQVSSSDLNVDTEVYEAKPTLVGSDRLEDMIPFKWRLVVEGNDDTSQSHVRFESFEYLDATSLAEDIAKEYRRRAQMFEKNVNVQGELAQELLVNKVYRMIGVGVQYLPVFDVQRDHAIEVNDQNALVSNLMVIRGSSTGFARYDEHPQFIRAKQAFKGQTVNTLWSFTVEESEVNGVSIVKCSGHHSCVCGVCW